MDTITYPDATKAKLKLAFAMGGGISLGCFSGGALTEIIKLALLKIVDRTASYGSVEIDVFTGASAGSLSLAVMFRGLCFRSDDEENNARKRLFDLHTGLKDQWDDLPEALREDLTAAQVAQDLQARAWVGGESGGITLSGLLGDGDPDRIAAMREGPGLLDAEGVYRIARKLLMKPDGEKVKISRRLLGNRCLFAPTLTNLTPFIADATKTFNLTSFSAPGLRDALRSLVHKDMRVFDIHFDENKEHPVANGLLERITESRGAEQENLKNASATEKGTDRYNGQDSGAQKAIADLHRVDMPERWFRMHEGDADVMEQLNDGKSGAVSWGLGQSKCWAEIAATAIASGAFPGAFQPAVLTRFQFEFGPKWWPAELAKANATEHPFAYVDGGVFNNDPIREAFRLCSFMDARDENGKFQRYLVYVDPSVGPESINYPIAGLREVGESDASFFNIDSPQASAFRPTLPRLASLLGSLLGVMAHQGRSREADGVAQTHNLMETRQLYRTAMRKLAKRIPAELAVDMHTELVTGCKRLFVELYMDLIPPGEGTLQGEMKRVIREESATTAEEPLGIGMLNLADSYASDGFANPDVNARRADWLWVHLCVYYDLQLGLEGKMQTTRILAITPYKKGDGKEPKPVRLLSDAFSAFGGFMWPDAQSYDFNVGRYCAGFFLTLETHEELEKQNVNGPLFYEAANPFLAPLPDKPAKEEYAAALRKGMTRVSERLEEAVESTFGGVAKAALSLLELRKALDGAVAPMIDRLYSTKDTNADKAFGMEFMILLNPHQNLRLDASGIRDRDATPVQRLIGDKFNEVLLTWATFENKMWTGGAVREGKYLLLQIPGKILEKDYSLVELPTDEKLEDLRAKALTHLRSVVVLNLSIKPAIVPAGNPPIIRMKHWEIWEGAAPLATRLRLG